MGRFSTSFNIADLSLLFCTQQPVIVTRSFESFLTEMQPDYIIEFREVSSLKTIPSDVLLYEGISFVVAADGKNGYVRRFRDVANDNFSYAIGTYDWLSKHITIEYLPYGQKLLQESGSYFFHVAWEALLMHEHRMMLHSACVDTPIGGLLFSGPSGIGKSTQAGLWCRYANSRLINGDRTIIRQDKNGWLAYGSPYAGSSKCYVNDSCPIRAIIFLKQAAACSVRRLDPAEGFRKVYACLTVNSWDKDFVVSACDFAAALAASVPIYELACTPDYEAVKMLSDVLDEEGEIK